MQSQCRTAPGTSWRGASQPAPARSTVMMASKGSSCYGRPTGVTSGWSSPDGTTRRRSNVGSTRPPLRTAMRVPTGRHLTGALCRSPPNCGRMKWQVVRPPPRLAERAADPRAGSHCHVSESLRCSSIAYDTDAVDAASRHEETPSNVAIVHRVGGLFPVDRIQGFRPVDRLDRLGVLDRELFLRLFGTFRRIA